MKIPMITLIRTCIYLLLAVFGGAGLLYDKALGPFLTKNEQKIDDGIEMIKDKLLYVFGVVFSYVKSFLISQLLEFVLKSKKPDPPKEEKPSVSDQ